MPGDDLAGHCVVGEAVALNPERDAVIGAHWLAEDKTRLLA